MIKNRITHANEIASALPFGENGELVDGELSGKYKYPKDETKEYRYDWDNLKIGDFVFDDSNVGFCSGGIAHGVGILVINITKKNIVTIDGRGKVEKWDKKTRLPKQPPTAYFLGAFQSNAT